MTELEQYKSVLADLEKASGWDRDLDTTILTVLLGMQDLGYVYEIDNWYYSRDGDEINPAFPSPTSSLDATIALVERELPGWEWLRKSPGTMTVYDPDIPEKTWAVHYDARGATPPLALLTAMFRALVAKMEGAE